MAYLGKVHNHRMVQVMQVLALYEVFSHKAQSFVLLAKILMFLVNNKVLEEEYLVNQIHLKLLLMSDLVK